MKGKKPSSEIQLKIALHGGKNLSIYNFSMCKLLPPTPKKKVTIFLLKTQMQYKGHKDPPVPKLEIPPKNIIPCDIDTS